MQNNSLKNIGAKGIAGIIAIVVAIVFLSCLGSIMENVKNNQIVVNQRPISGQIEIWKTPGMRGQWFGKKTIYYKTNQIWFDEIDRDEDGNLYSHGMENGAFPITYADKGKGFVLGSVRIELPLDDEHINLIHQHYGSERRLYEELVKPTIGKVILATGPLMTSLESVSEKRNDLVAYATDQLNYGIYQTKAITVTRLNIITNEQEKVMQAEIVTDPETGQPKRNEDSPFAKYGLKVSQLAIADLMYETATNNQISKQREAEMDIITAKAEAAKAQQQTIKTEEEGKQKAAAARWGEEARKAEAITKAEKEKEVAILNAQQAYEVAKLEAQKAQEQAKKIKAEGEATAAANRALVNAGLTPLERATIDKETKIGVAQALAGIKLPTIVMSGDSKGSAMDAVGLKMMMDMVDKVSK